MTIGADHLAWLVTAAVAAGLVGLCLAVIGSELETATRRVRLQQDAARLRAEQARRLRELAAVEAGRGRSQARSAPRGEYMLGDVEILE